MYYNIGHSINHCTYGKGKVIGTGYQKDTYKVRFEKSIGGISIRTFSKDKLKYM